MSNAEELLQTAQRSGDAGSYGPAIGLLVLAAEEALKAWTLTLHELSPGTSEDHLDALLRGHIPRHDLAAVLTLLGGLTGGERHLVFHLGKSLPRGFKPAKTKDWIAHLQQLFTIANELPVPSEQATVHSQHRDLLRHLQWWTEADTSKQAAFYVDWMAEDGEWRPPPTEEDYRQALSIVSGLVRELSDGLKHLNDMSPIMRALVRLVLGWPASERTTTPDPHMRTKTAQAATGDESLQVQEQISTLFALPGIMLSAGRHQRMQCTVADVLASPIFAGASGEENEISRSNNDGS